MFSKHHYLSHFHNNASNVYVCTVNGDVAGFISSLHFPHPIVKNMRKIHRLVIKPDYQGIGLGNLLLNQISDIYKKQNKRISIVTSSPSLIFSLKNSDKWACVKKGRQSRGSGSGSIHNKNKSNNSSSFKRITVSFEYRK